MKRGSRLQCHTRQQFLPLWARYRSALRCAAGPRRWRGPSGQAALRHWYSSQLVAARLVAGRRFTSSTPPAMQAPANSCGQPNLSCKNKIPISAAKNGCV